MKTGTWRRAVLNGITLAALGAVLALPPCRAAEPGGPVAGGAAVAADTRTAVRLLYREWEPGIDPYIIRTLVTPSMLRIDDNLDNGDFILFDRRKRVIYSVTHDAGTVLDIEDRPIERKPPFSLLLEHERIEEPDVPSVGKLPVTHFRYTANKEHCMDVFSVNGLLGSVVEARREFLSVLATEHAANLVNVPADMQQACDLATNVFYPGYHLQQGFALHQWTSAGYHRELLNYDTDVEVDARLFILPQSYRHYRTGQ